MIKLLDLEFLGHKETIASFLVESSDGPLLFETGPYSTYPVLLAQLEKYGYQPEDIKHVFLTHIHLDHAGAAWALAKAGATIYVHPRGAGHLADPSKLMASATRIYGDDMDRLWGRMESIPQEQIRTPGQSEGIRVGGHLIKAWHTPGHAVHHIAWQLGNQLIAGDVAGVKIGDGIVVPPCPPPDIHIEDWKESIQLLTKLNLQTIWLTHFGSVRNCREHLMALEDRLEAYAAWMRPYVEAGKTHEEVLPEFEKYTANELREHGIEGEQFTRYQSANPTWMSVAGLMRYWKKHGLGANPNG